MALHKHARDLPTLLGTSFHHVLHPTPARNLSQCLHDLIEALLLPSESLTAFLLYSFDVPLDFLLRDLDKNTFEVVAVPSYPKLPQPC